MSHKYISIKERNEIEILNKIGFSAREIAKTLSFHHSTISRELKRCPICYSSAQAEHNYSIKAKNKGRRCKLTSHLKDCIEVSLKKTWSPEQIAGRLLIGSLSFKTIYNWIYKGLLEVSLKVLRRKGNSKNHKNNRGKFSVGTPISKRPKYVRERIEFGHWELDTMVSSRGRSKGCLATFAEMKTRMYVALKIPDRSGESMFKAIKQFTNSISKEAFKSFTSDRGKEFACYKDVEDELGVDFYFADPYSAWQRGTNENSNGLLREFYPKKTDLLLIDNNDLKEAIYKINSRPRKCLGFRTSFEEFLHEIDNLS